MPKLKIYNKINKDEWIFITTNDPGSNLEVNMKSKTDVHVYPL